MPEPNVLPITGLIISVLSILSALSYKFYRDSKKDNTKKGFDQGKTSTIIQHLKEELEQVNHVIENIENDVEKGHMDYDSIQKQITDIRERLARLEGPQ